MLVIISPAKIQNFKPEILVANCTQPEFLDQAENLVQQIRQLSVITLSKLLKTNLEIAKLNAERFSIWHRPFNAKNAKQTIMVFNGEVFHGLDVRTLNNEHFEYLQNHLRIFSGLYGLLRPFDLIQPYRLDISDPIITERGKNLYDWWGEQITLSLNKALKKSGKPKILLNLSSGEYIKSINRKSIDGKVIDIEFLENQADGYKTIVVYTKKARGLFTRFVIENRIENPEYIKAFDSEGYLFTPSLSTEERFVFTR